eukprot:4967816-Lingulodinium_polyedra.AAC.1
MKEKRVVWAAFWREGHEAALRLRELEARIRRNRGEFGNDLPNTQPRGARRAFKKHSGHGQGRGRPRAERFGPAP